MFTHLTILLHLPFKLDSNRPRRSGKSFDYKKHNKPYDLVISDLNLPNKNGIALSKNIIKINNEQAIIIISAYNEKEKLQQLINMSISSFLLKPIEINKMTKILYNVCKETSNKKDILNYYSQKIKSQNKEIYKGAYIDKLTSLPNRTSLIELLSFEAKIGLLFIDIKNFGQINNFYGINGGDQILKQTALELKYLANQNGCKVFRISADEFAFLNPTPKEPKFCIEMMENILKTIREKNFNITIDKVNTTLNIDLTMGFSFKEDNPLEKAHLALEHAKNHNLSYYQYNNELANKLKENLTISQLIKNAIEKDQVIPFFQPIISKDNTIKYESLMRIKNNDEIITPDKFLSIAKQTDNYIELTKIMINKTFEYFHDKEYDFSLNISIEDINNTKLVEHILKMTNMYNVSQKLIFEIVEQEEIKDYEIVINFIKIMKSKGIRIAIDDFGSGYSNFLYLLKLEPDFIKIDGSIIKNLDTDLKSYTIAKTIVNFSKELNIQTIAEFVHNKTILEKIQELDIDFKQGYFVGKPKITI